MESDPDVCVCCDGWGRVAGYGECPLCDGCGDLNWSEDQQPECEGCPAAADPGDTEQGAAGDASSSERQRCDGKFFSALQRGDRARIVQLLRGRADVNANDEMGRRPLHEAARFGRVALASALLERRAELEAADEPERTALHKAAAGGHCEAVRVLLGFGAAFGSVDAYGQTPLHLAAARGHGEVARLLIARGADVGAQDYLRRTPLHAAERLWRAGVVDPLIDHRADLHARDVFQRLPLEGLPDRVIGLRFSREDPSDRSVGVRCLSLVGEVLASVRLQTEGEPEETLDGLLADLAVRLAVPRLKLKPILPDGQLLSDRDSLADLAERYAV